MVNAILILQSYGQHNPVYMPFVCTDYEFVKSHVGDKFGYDLKLTSESQAFANICLTPESLEQVSAYACNRIQATLHTTHHLEPGASQTTVLQ